MTGGGKEEEEVTLMYVILLLRKLENQSLCFGDGYLSGLGFYVGMGCSGSKVDSLPLVIRCRERRDLIRAAADHRYALAAAHVAYFNSMKNVGDALRRFVEEELILAATSSSSSSTPTTTSSSGVTLHSLKEDGVEHEDEEEQGQEDLVQDKKINELHHRNKSKSTGKGKTRNRSKIKGERQEDESGSGTSHVHHFHGGDDSDSHLHFSSDESVISHIHDLGDVGYEDMDIHHGPGPGPGSGPYSNGYGYGYGYVPSYGGFGIMDPAGQGAYSVQYPSYFGMNQPYQAWDGIHDTGMNFQNNPHIYYMRKSSPAVKTVIHRPEPVMEPVMNGYTNPYFGYPMQNEGFYGFQTGPPSIIPEKKKPTATPPPPSPKASAWDFLNPFDEYDNGYSGNEYRYGVGQDYVSSSPDSTEVRMREGIPDLEEETEHEAYTKAQKGRERREEGKRQYSADRRTAETSSPSYRVMPSHKRREDRQPSDSVSGSLHKRKKDRQPLDSVSGSLHKRREDGQPSDSVSGSSHKRREDRQPSDSVSGSSHKRREDRQPSDSVSRSSYKQREDRQPSESVSRSSYKQREDRKPSDSASRPSDKRREKQHLGSVSGSSSVTFSHHKKDDESSSSEPISLHKSSSEYSTKIIPVRKGTASNSNKMPVSHYRGNTDSTQTPHQHNVDTSRTVPTEKSENGVYITEDDSSHETLVSLKSPVDMYVRKKGVSFEVDETTKSDIESSKTSSFATFSVNGSRDLREVVAEIRDEFVAAYDNGKEVAVMLDVEKLPYQPNIIRVILSRMLYLISPSLSSSYPPSIRSIRLAAKTVKLAKSYFGDAMKDIEAEPCNLVSTFEKLYAWEKKLYKEVKNEERLRIAYDKQFKRLKSLDQRGAESNKIDFVRASIRNLLTRLNVSIKSIDAISCRIQKLRDEELHPQVSKLIYGMIRMWRLMLSCHQKQFQAIKESKLRALRAKTDSQKDSTLRATCDLEKELRLWCGHFNDWITTQKAYVESLNGWLTQCLDYKPEETPDGPVPFSPGQFGAPPIFIICHDWKQAMETLSETGVANAMNKFASSLRDLWEKQDEEQRQRLIADDLSEDFRNRLKNTTTASGGGGGGESLVASENGGVDLKVDLDTVQKRLTEEKAKHKDAIKILNYAASNSVQGGLVPIFRALESFSMEALKAHEKVRLQVDDEHR